MTEPTPELPTGVWFENQNYLGYRGGAVILHFDQPNMYGNLHAVTRCSSCEIQRLRGQHKFGKVIRWMILPK